MDRGKIYALLALFKGSKNGELDGGRAPQPKHDLAQLQWVVAAPRSPIKRHSFS